MGNIEGDDSRKDQETDDLTIKAEEYLEIISTEDERIKIIGEELANDTGRAIFGKISQGIASPNDLAKALNISLPLINWHINRLLSVGLVKVEKIELSSKNKQMKYYGPVKTALVIIPPENSSGNTISQPRKETVLLKLRQYMASFAAFVVGAPGIYFAEKNQSPEMTSYAPQMAAKEIAPSEGSLHAAAPMITSTAAAPAPEPSVLSGEPMMILIAVLGGAAIFCAMFFGIRLYNKRRKIRKLN
ncbi:MAG: winged helix-turn-helix transcriptional regulator [Thaumarchaeota archaeon]|nr:winged helix-turn-helix transcriptional regulator [Nitrososphaerota archaeon]MBI3641638.1 winged helix-turn-helix transcriptional regulator [Nitrososphaerota archaeon]